MTNYNNYQFNIKKSEHDHRDYTLESIYNINPNLPKIWDMRESLPKIKDQGSEGTCSAQTAACMKEWQEHVDVGLNEAMSPQFVYNLRQDKETSGMTPRNTMEILKNIGIVTEKEYPYLSFTPITSSLKTSASKFKIAGYAQIGTIESLKQALYTNGPCYLAFPVYNANNMEFWKQEFPSQPAQGGHAVACVGWNEDSFIIRNSWGTRWGDHGYTYYKFNQWGLHWEVWTSLDADTKKLIKDSKNFIKK